MTDILLILLILVVSVAVVVLFLKKNTIALAKQFKSEEDVTTVLPISIHAATCDHDWEILKEQVLEMPHEKKIILVLVCRRCGTIDKTVQVTSPQPPPQPCSHDWETVIQQNLDVAHEKKVVIILTCRRCGTIDKTIEVTSKSPEKAWCKADCRHKWQTEKRITLESAYEQMLKSISAKQTGKNAADKQKIDLDLNNAPTWMFAKKYVSIKVCSVCGEVDKTITSNFDSENPEGEQE